MRDPALRHRRLFTVWTANANAILQVRAPDHLRGRVVSLYLWAFAGLAPVGGLLAGWLCDVGGAQLSLTVAGVTGLAVTLVAARQRASDDRGLHRPNAEATTG